MDFTFDNPFDDVFTDPQAAQQTPGAQDAPAAAVVAEVPPTPVAIEPVQQQPTTFVQPTQTNATTAPVTANPAQASPATHSATIPAQNPAITSPQMFTPLVTPAQPTAVQPVAPGTLKRLFLPIALDPASARTSPLHSPVFRDITVS